MNNNENTYTHDPMHPQLLIALGPAAPFVETGHAYVVGGALARIGCDLPLRLPLDDDIPF